MEGSGKALIILGVLFLSLVSFSVIVGIQITDVAKTRRDMDKIVISTTIEIEFVGDDLDLSITLDLYNPFEIECVTNEFDLILHYGDSILGIVNIDSFDLTGMNETISFDATMTPEESVIVSFSAGYEAHNTPIHLSGTLCFVAEAIFDGVTSTHKIDEDILV